MGPPSYKEFQLQKSGLSNIDLALNGTVVYHVEVNLMSSKKDIIMFSGAKSIPAALVGDVDLRNFSGHYAIELFSPESAAKKQPIIEEELDKIPRFGSRHAFHFSEFEGVSGGVNGAADDRTRFVWRHPGDMKRVALRGDLELVEIDEEGDIDEETGEEGPAGESETLLGQYLKNGEGSNGWKGRGLLKIKNGIGGEKWERMVILSAMALIISKRRES